MTKKKNEIQKSNTEDVDFFKCFNDTATPRVNCKLCNWEKRTEAEALFDRTKNMTVVKRFCDDNGLDASYPAVRNHLLNHYKKIERQIMLKEYARDIDNILSQKTNRKTSLEVRKAMLLKEMVVIASETEGKSLDERRKSADALKKLNDTIGNLEDKISEIDEDMMPVFILIENLKDIISTEIKKSNNEQVKSALMSLLEKLSENIGALEINMR